MKQLKPCFGPDHSNFSFRWAFSNSGELWIVSLLTG